MILITNTVLLLEPPQTTGTTKPRKISRTFHFTFLFQHITTIIDTWAQVIVHGVNHARGIKAPYVRAFKGLRHHTLVCCWVPLKWNEFIQMRETTTEMEP